MRSGSLLAIAALVAGGCRQVGEVRPGEPIPDEPERTLAFGSLRISERGRPIVPPSTELEDVLFADDPFVRLSLYRIETGQKWVFVPYDLDDGRFEWLLPRGTYLLYHARVGPPTLLRVLAAFQLGPGASAVYAGRLVIDVDSIAAETEGLPPECWVEDVALEDDFDAARDELLRRHPDGEVAVARGVTVIDPELETVFDDWSSESCWRILARHGVQPLGL